MYIYIRIVYFLLRFHPECQRKNRQINHTHFPCFTKLCFYIIYKMGEQAQPTLYTSAQRPVSVLENENSYHDSQDITHGPHKMQIIPRYWHSHDTYIHFILNIYCICIYKRNAYRCLCINTVNVLFFFLYYIKEESIMLVNLYHSNRLPVYIILNVLYITKKYKFNILIQNTYFDFSSELLNSL